MPDPTFNIADSNDADLGNFFARPIKIQSFTWGTNLPVYHVFNPWQDFFENPRVLNRITNFNLLRCKLKVRIMLNGNSFHFGRAIASYNPLHEVDDFTRTRGFVIQDIVSASQRPHVYLDPTTNQGGSLTLPFVWYENALRIPDQEWRNMGEIAVQTMQNLKHANDATDQVIISVFAWAEDVSLSIPTANEPGALSPQMGEIFSPQVKDEYGTGPISRPAGVLSRAAGLLSKAPVIGPYARATEMAASTVSNIATLFGYSRPAVLADITPYKPTYGGNMANTNVPDSCQKLTLDAKQELTIDPRVMGLGNTDELSIKSIAQRESFLTQFAWNVTSPSESLLWNCEVSPVVWNEVPTAEKELHFPACCFATLPFKRWRGSMKYRFQIVASAYHKGRIKITYDPSYPLTNEYNTNYTYIVDLAKERDFTVQIGWGHEKSYLSHRTPGVDVMPYSDTVLGADPGIYANGIISVYVVNDLTVPNSIADNDIEVNVFVSAADDFEVADPDSSYIEEYVWFKPQIGEVLSPQMAEANQPDADHTKNEDEPMKISPSQIMAPVLSDSDNTGSVYYGDPVTSFRQCLKRYNFHTSISSVGAPASGRYYLRLRTGDFPYYRGYAPGAVHSTSVPVATPYNYCKMTLLNYLTPAFASRRGGMRWKYFMIDGTDTKSFLSVTRDASPGAGYAQIEDNVLGLPSSLSSRIREVMDVIPHTWDGTTITATHNNPVIEVELPFYSNIRFFPGKQANMTGPPENFKLYHYLTTMFSASSNATHIHSYCSVAEDFTLGFFLGAPVAWRIGADPLAST